MSEAAADTRDEAVSDGAIRVRRALISVSDKTGVADFAKSLAGARGRDPLHRRHRRARCARPGSR